MTKMMQDFLIPFATIAIAEMGDKTQLAMMALAARHRHTLQIFMGAMAASAVVDGSAVALGSIISRYIPRNAVSVAAGIVFIAFGMLTLVKKEEKGRARLLSKKALFIVAFMLFFVSEFGDKSQFAALLFGAQYNLLLAILGTLTAIGLLLIVMLNVGKYVSRKIDERKITILSAALFIGLGAYFLVKAAAG